VLFIPGLGTGMTTLGVLLPLGRVNVALCKLFISLIKEEFVVVSK